jgi:hypothetical protein
VSEDSVQEIHQGVVLPLNCGPATLVVGGEVESSGDRNAYQQADEMEGSLVRQLEVGSYFGLFLLYWRSTNFIDVTVQKAQR